MQLLLQPQPGGAILAATEGRFSYAFSLPLLPNYGVKPFEAALLCISNYKWFSSRET